MFALGREQFTRVLYLNMNNEYPWVKANTVFSVTAQYNEKDRGAFFRDDCADEKWSVRLGAAAASYHVIGHGNKEFSSPEETILYLYALAPDGFALDLQMCDREANKFLHIWKSMQSRREVC